MGICWMKATYDRRFFFMTQKRKMQKYAAKNQKSHSKYNNGIVRDNQWQYNRSSKDERLFIENICEKYSCRVIQ